MPLPRLLDTVLDRLVVPGYSRFGYALRQRGEDATVTTRS